MRKLLIAFCFILNGLSSRASTIDSLRMQLPMAVDSSRADLLLQLAFQFISISQKDSATIYTDRGLALARKLNYIHGIAEGLWAASRIAKHFNDDFVRSENLARESLQWYLRTPNQKGLEHVYHGLWYALFAESKFEEANDYARKFYVTAAASNNTKEMYDALSDLSVIHFQQGLYDSAFYYCQQAYELAVKEKNRLWRESICFNFGTIYRAIGDYHMALEYYRRGFVNNDSLAEKYRIDNDFDIWVKMEYAELFALNGFVDSAWHYYRKFDSAHAQPKDLRVYLVSTAETMMLEKDYAHALSNLMRGLTMHRDLNDVNEIKRTLIDISKSELALGNKTVALRYAREGLDLAIRTKSKQYMRDAYHILQTVYDSYGQVDSAYFYYKKYNYLQECINNDKTSGRLVAFQYDEKLARLQQEQLIGQQKINLQHQQLHAESVYRKVLIGSICFLIAIGIILFRFIMLQRKHERLRYRQEQAELKQQTSELEMEALRAQMSPHFIFNCLNSINRFILKNETEAASDYLTKFSRLIRMVLHNSKSKLISLEDELSTLKLYLDMERLRFAEMFEYKINVAEDVDLSGIFIPPMLLQPFAENAIWHGLMNKQGAGCLDIKCFIEGPQLVCVITDNGIGREMAALLKSKSVEKQKSMGLKITAGRLALINTNPDSGASFQFVDLKDADGRATGTRVTLRINIRQSSLNVS